jgi:hypothetical protein
MFQDKIKRDVYEEKYIINVHDRWLWHNYISWLAG